MAGGDQVQQLLAYLQPALDRQHAADGGAVSDKSGQHLAIDAGGHHTEAGQLAVDLLGGQRQQIGLALTLAV